MAFLEKKNNAESLTTDNPLAIAAVTVNVTGGEGSEFPSSGDFILTIWDAVTYPDPGDDSNMEIVRATARSTDAITITRAQEGTADVAHSQGSAIAMLITAGTLDDALDQDVKTSDSVSFTSITDGTATLTGGDLTGAILESVGIHSDVDTTTEASAKNDVLMFNGSNYVPVVEGTTFTFSCTSFSDGQSTLKLIGTGDWEAAEAISFTAIYENGPPTTADIQKSINGGAYATINAMDGAAYTSGNNTAAVAYPAAKDQYLRFRLSSGDGVDTDLDYDSAIYFRNYIRWGGSTTGSGFNEASVEALDNSAISNGYTTSRSVNASSGTKYVVWSFPSTYTSTHALGARFNSVTMPFTAPETVSITNIDGYTENYKVFASIGTDLGNSTLTLLSSANLIDPFYYGGSTLNTGWSAAQIKALTDVESPVTNDTTQTFNTVTMAASEYYVFAYPSRLTDPTNWYDNSTSFPLSLNAGSPETVSITNVNGYTENYDVWVSNQILGPGDFQLRTT